MSRNPDIARNGDIVSLTVYTVGTVPIQVAQSRPARRTIQFSACGSEAITLGLSSAVASGQGILVDIGVDPVSYCRSEYAPLVASDVWAVAAAAGGTLAVLEIVDNPSATN